MKTYVVKQGRPYKFRARNSILFIAAAVAVGLMVTLPIQDQFNYTRSSDAAEKIATFKLTRLAQADSNKQKIITAVKNDNQQLELAIKAATASAKYVKLSPQEAKEMIATTFPKEYRDRFAKITMQCENGTLENNRMHTNKDGTKDVGMSQINDKWHRARVERMFGMDFDLAMQSPLLNYIYAAYLVEHDKNFHQWACDKLVG